MTYMAYMSFIILELLNIYGHAGIQCILFCPSSADEPHIVAGVELGDFLILKQCLVEVQRREFSFYEMMFTH